jgi:hypothetical protein
MAEKAFRMVMKSPRLAKYRCVNAINPVIVILTKKDFGYYFGIAISCPYKGCSLREDCYNNNFPTWQGDITFLEEE